MHTAAVGIEYPGCLRLGLEHGRKTVLSEDSYFELGSTLGSSALCPAVEALL